MSLGQEEDNEEENEKMIRTKENSFKFSLAGESKTEKPHILHITFVYECFIK